MLMPYFKSSRRIENWELRVAFPALCLALLLGMQGGAQQGVPMPPMHSRYPPPSTSEQPLGNDDDLTDHPAWQARQLRAMNVERQKALVSDTNKLLKLAHELDAEVSATTSDSLTSDQIRKLAEIEKLAHSVKEKMGISQQGPLSTFPQQYPPMMR